MLSTIRAILLGLLAANAAFSTTWQVSKSGNDASTAGPFLTINKAAQVAQPGDSVIVRAGEYREWVQPARGGSSESTRIVYKAAPGEVVEIKGSERVTTWVSQGNGVWKADLTDAFFGSYNPFSYTLEGKYPGEGSQYITSGQWCHLGEVYLDGQIYLERQTLAEVQSTQKTWCTSRSGTTNSVYANFGTANPNTQLAEVNAREAVFGNPNGAGAINFVTVDGFRMSQSADAWCPPYRGSPASSFAVLFPWGDSWIIRNCIIKYAKMRGVCLDGASINTIVRDNVITECGIAGVCGSSANGSIISGNWISDIHGPRPYGGDEHGCVKFNTTKNVTICGNVLRKMIAPTQGRTIMCDYNGDGWRITGNVLTEATETLIYWLQNNFSSSSAILVDNNVFIGSPYSGTQVYYVHNLYGQGGGSASGNNIVLGALTHVDDTAAKTITLTFTLSSTVAAQNNTIMTTASLGTNVGNTFPGVSLNKDIQNECRTSTAKSGPFQKIVSGANTFVFRPNSKFLDNVPCGSSTMVRNLRAPGIASGLRVAGSLIFAHDGKQLSIVDSRGQVVAASMGSDGRIRLRNLPRGVYQARVRTDRGLQVMSIVR
jgi:hypothetical protein